MKRRILVADAVPSFSQRHKILHGFRRRLAEQSEHNATGFLAINFHVEENLVSDGRLARLLQQNILHHELDPYAG